MFEYLEIEDIRPHILILTPIVTMFFIAFIKKSKGMDKWKKSSLFFELLPRIIISYVICGIAATLLAGVLLVVVPLSEMIFGYYWISDATFELLGTIVLIIIGTVSSYITMIKYN